MAQAPGTTPLTSAKLYGYRFRLWLDRANRAERRLVRDSMEVPSIRQVAGSGKVWVIEMVKNEVDVIRAQIEHHLEQDVDVILIADNGSTDGTLEELQDLANEHPVIVCRDRLIAYHQASKMTYLAHLAAMHGADWVVPVDADEFWQAPNSSLGKFLRNTSTAQEFATIYNCFPVNPDGYSLIDRENVFEIDTHPAELRKVAFRSHRAATLKMGNHSVIRGGIASSSLVIAHLPWRSRAQLFQKLRQGKAAYDATSANHRMGTHWRSLGAGSDEELEVVWSRIVDRKPDPTLSWSPHGPFQTGRPLAAGNAGKIWWRSDALETSD